MAKALTIAELEDLRRFAAEETGSSEAALSAVLRAVQLGSAQQLERKAPAPILRATCEHFGVTAAELVGPRRTAHVAGARMVAMFLLRAANLPYQEIADLLGRRGHSDVVYGCRRVEGDENLRAQAAAVARLAEDSFQAGKAPVIFPRRKAQ